jgi:Ca2+-binding EF-hand superfamily protein
LDSNCGVNGILWSVLQEMQSAMERSGYVSQDDAAQIMKATDVNNDGQLTYDEFVLAAAQVRVLGLPIPGQLT